MLRLSLAMTFVLAACSYDGSATLAPGEEDRPGDAPADDRDGSVALSSCLDFVSVPCLQCGQEVCLDDRAGARIVCEPRPGEGRCGDGRSCTADAVCEEDAAFECEYDEGSNYRSCGECGWEFCLESGVWSGVCNPNQAFCGGDGTCLQTDTATFECIEVVPTCDTTGYQEPCGDDDEPPPLIVDAGTVWNTAEGCTLIEELPTCRTCSCVDLGNGGAEVQCDVCEPILLDL